MRIFSLDPRRLELPDDPVAARVRLKLISNLSEINLKRLERANREIRFLTT